MAIFVVNHKVNDFGIWKKAYDQFDSAREKYQITDHFVLQSTEDPNHVTVIGEAELANIQQFLGSDDLKNAMMEAGVTGPPEIFIGENKL